jgi:NADP-dependent 3-hydroxy acid dehydrogenase YdfG
MTSFLLVLLLFLLNVSAKNPAAPPKSVVVLITGCSSGIGEATALRLAGKNNYKIWATMRNTEKWNHEPISNLVVAQLDVTLQSSIDNVVARIVQEHRKIDVVINCAGYGIAGSLEMIEVAHAQSMFDVNVWGIFRVLQSILPHMRKRKSGHIINLSGTSGIRGIPCLDMYIASKFALEGMMESTRYSVAPYNISITNINAGPVKSMFSQRLSREVGNRTLDDKGYARTLTERLLLGLAARVSGPDAQTSDQLADHIVAIMEMRLKAKRLTDVPFNIGSTMDSQEILEDVRVNPTGWGGIYNEILKGVPPLPSFVQSPANDLKEEL